MVAIRSADAWRLAILRSLPPLALKAHWGDRSGLLVEPIAVQGPGGAATKQAASPLHSQGEKKDGLAWARTIAQLRERDSQRKELGYAPGSISDSSA